MKTFRIVLGILALIPLALLADKILFHATDYDCGFAKNIGLCGDWCPDYDFEPLGVDIS